MQTEEIEDLRAKRRDYQRRYRKGLIPPRSPKVIARKDEGGVSEKRRSFAYYLTPALAKQLKEYCEANDRRRREVVTDAIGAYLGKTFLPPPADRSEDRVFQYDEVSIDLMDRIDEATTKNKPRILKCDLAAEAIRLFLNTPPV